MNLTSMSVRHKASNQNPSGLSRGSPRDELRRGLAALHRHATPDGGDSLLKSLCAIDDEKLGAVQVAQRIRR